MKSPGISLEKIQDERFAPKMRDAAKNALDIIANKNLLIEKGNPFGITLQHKAVLTVLSSYPPSSKDNESKIEKAAIFLLEKKNIQETLKQLIKAETKATLGQDKDPSKYDIEMIIPMVSYEDKGIVYEGLNVYLDAPFRKLQEAIKETN